MKRRIHNLPAKLRFPFLMAATFLSPIALHASGLVTEWGAVFMAAGFAVTTIVLWRAHLLEHEHHRQRREHQYLRSVIDAIPHFIFARDASGRFTLVNKAVADFYGMPVDQVEGRHLLEVHPDADQARAWLEEDRETLASGEPWSLPVTDTTNADGRPMWIAAMKKPLPSPPSGGSRSVAIRTGTSRVTEPESRVSQAMGRFVCELSATTRGTATAAPPMMTTRSFTSDRAPAAGLPSDHENSRAASINAPPVPTMTSDR